MKKILKEDLINKFVKLVTEEQFDTTLVDRVMKLLKTYGFKEIPYSDNVKSAMMDRGGEAIKYSGKFTYNPNYLQVFWVDRESYHGLSSNSKANLKYYHSKGIESDHYVHMTHKEEPRIGIVPYLATRIKTAYI